MPLAAPLSSLHSPVPHGSDFGSAVRRGLLAGAAVVAVMLPWSGPDRLADVPTPAVALSTQVVPAARRTADFGADMPSPDARFVANWIADSRDNAGMNFVIVDKRAAKAYAFDAEARLRGASPVLLGAARGDDSVPGIGSKAIADVRPEERTTPAGRFVGEIGRNALNEDVVWVDYDAAVSMHRVRLTNPKERRLERLASPEAAERRISYGCINMPVTFYETFIGPAFTQRRGVVYVLPDVKSVQQVFGAHGVAARPADRGGRTAAALATAPCDGGSCTPAAPKPQTAG